MLRVFPFLFISIGLHAQPAAKPLPADANAGNAKTVLEADDVVYFDGNIKRLVAYPNARLSSGKTLLTANRIEYDRNSTNAFAKGDVIFTNGKFRLLAEDMEMNLSTGDFNASEVKAGFYPWATESKEISSEKGIITSEDSFFYLRERHPLEPNLGFRQLTFDQNKSAFKGEGIALRIGSKTIGKLPSLSGNIGTNPFHYGLHAGKKDRLGWYLGTSGDFQLSESIGAEGELTAYEKRGVFLSPRLDWRKEEGNNFQRGSIEMGWIEDQGNDLGLDLRGLTLSETRGYLHAYSVNRIDERWRIAGQIERDGDSEVFRDFQRDRFQEHQWNDHFGEIAYESDNWTFSAFSRWQANKHEAMVEMLPSLRFDLAPTPWPNSKIYNSVAIELTGFRERDNSGNLLQRSRRLDLGYQIQRPIKINHGLVYTPFLSYRRQDYSLDGPNAQRSWGELGNEIHYTLHGDYALQNETWKIDGLRHVADLSISHRKVNRLDSENSSLIPLIDRSLFDLNLGPTDLLDRLEGDGLEPYEVVRVGWGNYLLTRDGQSTRELLGVHFFQDLWQENESGNDLQRNFYSDIEIHPAHWISLRGQTKIDLDQGETVRNTLSAILKDGRVNEFEVSYFNYLSFGDQWQFLASHRMDERKTIHGALRTQGDRPKIPYWQVAVEYRPSKSWIWFFHVAKRSGTSKENDWETAVSARLFSF
jgi:hypothetical protein